MKDVKGKVALVTGGGSGIGLSMVQAFLDAGMKVAIADIRADRLQKVEQTLNNYSGQFITVVTNVSVKESLIAAADAAEAEFGRIHVLCNNAGVGMGGRFLDVTDEQWQNILNINTWGPIYGTQTVLPRILAHGEGGHIVNTASIAGMSQNCQAIYGTSKFAVVGLSEALKGDLRDTEVGISVLAPWLVTTPIWHPDIDDDDVKGIEQRRKNLEQNPTFAGDFVDVNLVGQQVLSAIQNDEFYIFCDGNATRKILEQRHADMMGAISREFPQ